MHSYLTIMTMTHSPLKSNATNQHIWKCLAVPSSNPELLVSLPRFNLLRPSALLGRVRGHDVLRLHGFREGCVELAETAMGS